MGVLSFVVYAAHGYGAGLDRDLGVFTYGGLQLAQGTPPYVGVFNSVGPLADAVPGLAIRLGRVVGADPVLAERLLFTVLSALCCSLLCVLARDTLGSRAAGFLAPAAFLPFHGFLALASGGPREKTTMVLLLLACLVLLGRRRWVLAGTCAALATLTWQPVLAVALGALAAAVLLDQQDTRRRILLRFTLGGLVPSAVTVSYFLVVGALSRAVDGFIVVNVEYTRQPSLLTRPHQVADQMWWSYGWSLVLVIGGLAALLVLGARAVPLARRPTVSPAARRLVVCAAGGSAGTVWTVLVVNGAPDLFVLLPFAALGAAALTLLLLDRLPRRAAVVGVAALATLSVLAAGAEAVTTRSDRLSAQRADVAAVLGTQPPGATVVSLGAPQVLALSGRESPVPFQVLGENQARYLEATYPGGLPGFVRALREVDPTFVAVGVRVPWARAWLHHGFWRVGGSGDGWRWYLNRCAGRDALLRARTAYDEAPAAAGTGNGFERRHDTRQSAVP